MNFDFILTLNDIGLENREFPQFFDDIHFAEHGLKLLCNGQRAFYNYSIGDQPRLVLYDIRGFPHEKNYIREFEYIKKKIEIEKLKAWNID